MSFRNNWIQLAHYQGHEINPLGEIRNIRSGRILNSSVNQYGVQYVSIRNTTLGHYENKAVGVLVAETFIEGKTDNAETVLHLDGNTENNNAENLMWATRWHAMAYHDEIRKQNWNPRKKVVDENRNIYSHVGEAAMATGCLPSAIDYACRYNENLAQDEHVNFVHKTQPGAHIFRWV